MTKQPRRGITPDMLKPVAAGKPVIERTEQLGIRASAETAEWMRVTAARRKIKMTQLLEECIECYKKVHEEI
jgi:hypothetical protein